MGVREKPGARSQEKLGARSQEKPGARRSQEPESKMAMVKVHLGGLAMFATTSRSDHRLSYAWNHNKSGDLEDDLQLSDTDDEEDEEEEGTEMEEEEVARMEEVLLRLIEEKEEDARKEEKEEGVVESRSTNKLTENKHETREEENWRSRVTKLKNILRRRGKEVKKNEGETVEEIFFIIVYSIEF